MVLLIIFSVLSELLAISTGFAKAVADLSEEGKIKFKPSRYWIKAMSSPNKWKDGDPRKGEKFFGSSRWFAFMLFLYPFSMLIFHLFYNSKKLTK
jgi:hypothetical protein